MRRIALLSTVALLAACGGSSSSSGTGYLRVANLSFNPVSSVAMDFCWAPQGSTAFVGPAMKGASDGFGLAYESVSRYFSLAEGSYTVRVVPFAANSCATAVPGLADVGVTVLSGTYYTVAAAGTPGSTELKAFTDEHTPDAAKVIIRFLNAVPGPTALDIGTGTPAAFTPLFDNLTYLGLATATPPVNSIGYAIVAPSGFAPPIVLTTCVHGQPRTAQTCPISVTLTADQAASIKGGTVASAFLVPTLTGGELVLCGDSVGTVPGTNLSACVVKGP